MFLKRSYQREIMDDFSIRDKRIDDALDELKVVNKFLGGISSSSSGFKEVQKRNLLHNYNKPLKVLDIGAGASDNVLNLRSNSLKMDITSIDINPRACAYLHKNSEIKKIVCADVKSLPFNSRFSLVHSSLFLHHFKEEEIAAIIRNLLSYSEIIIINDLRRSLLAYIGIKILTMFFSKSKMLRNDAPLSVKRGFTKKDWQFILSQAGIRQYKIYRKWAFRWLIIIYANEEV